MRRVAFLSCLGVAFILLGNGLIADVRDYTVTVNSPGPALPTVEESNSSLAVAQFAYDAALTNIGVHAPRDTCIFEGDDLTIWVKVHNAGYEIVDCAEVLFTLNGVEFGRVHVAGLYPDEVRKYSATTVASPGCEPYTIDAHIDWPPDENPDNDDIEDIFATGEEADTCLCHGDGHVDGWSYPPGYEYPDWAAAAKYHIPFEGVVKYWTWWYTQSTSYPRGHIELFVWAADPQTGYPIDDGTGGLYDVELQIPDIYWPDIGFVGYPVCMPVSEDQYYFFGYSNRQGTVNYFHFDPTEDNPDWNWYKASGVWYPGNLYNGDFWVEVYMDVAGVMMTCENLTPIFCRGTHFNFMLKISNYTEDNVSGPMAFSGHSGYDCDPANNLVTIMRAKTYPPGHTVQAYRFKVPYAVTPGEYSASINGTLNPGGYELFCCMNTDIVQCHPWRTGHNAEWGLVEVDYLDPALPAKTILHQNNPNPFNATTTIAYELPLDAYVRLEVYNLGGERVVTLIDGRQEAGYRSVLWDACQVSAGLYFYRLSSGEFTHTRKMVLVK